MSQDISVWISDLNSADAEIRSRAAEALSRLGEDASGAALSLVRAAGDAQEEVQEWAVAALEELGSPAAADVNALIELLPHESSDVGYWSATLLGRLGADAVVAVPALCAALDEGRPLPVRERSAWALGRIGPAAGETAIAHLTRAASDSNPRVSRLAQRALERVSR